MSEWVAKKVYISKIKLLGIFSPIKGVKAPQGGTPLFVVLFCAKLMFTAPRRIMGQFQSLLIELNSPSGSRRNRDAKVRRSKIEKRRFSSDCLARMAANENQDDSLYPIAVLIDELRNEDVQVCYVFACLGRVQRWLFTSVYLRNFQQIVSVCYWEPGCEGVDFYKGRTWKKISR